MLAHLTDFSADRAETILAEIPAAPAVFVLRGERGSEPYVSKSADLRRRLTRLLGPPEEGSKRLNLRQRCRSIEYQPSGSDFESAFLLYRVLRAEFPKTYRERLKLRFAPLIKLNLENPYPRAYVTRRIAKLGSRSRYYGPFPSRAAAEKFLNDALDFFKMRRCDFDLDPDPAFPGCMYSEMKMCLAPCFKGCTDEQYAAEVTRVQEFFESSGRSLLQELSTEREHASGRLEFEQAAAIHARAEKIHSILGAATLPEIVHPIGSLNAVIVQRGPELNAVQLFNVAGGMVSAPQAFRVEQNLQASLAGAAKEDSEKRTPRSMESRISEALEGIASPVPQSATELNENLALLKRWYYRSRRAGEIFFAEKTGALPLRRIVRGVGRVLKGERAELGESEDAHRAYWLARTREPEQS
ncbi:MAG TPA: excinuclease ABC subunit C [Terriglobales bacterium]|nr:excinuclease ABC subunit C [Terriglobales bacterium]